MAMEDLPLPVLGIDMRAKDTELRAGTARSVVNVDLGRAVLRRRGGYTTRLASHDLTGIHRDGARVLLGVGHSLCELDLAGMVATPIADMGSSAPLDFCEHAKRLYVANGDRLMWMPAGGAPKPVGLVVPALPDVVQHANGTLAPGMYSLAISLVDESGEESGASMLGTLRLEGGAKLVGLPVIPGSSWRLYITPPGGDVLYLAEQVPALLTEHVMTVYPGGAQCMTLNLQPMPAGELVRGHAGRLYVARGDALWFSEAFRPHLTRRRSNFVRFHGRIRFIEVMEGGAYVGDDEGTWWLAGTDPTGWAMSKVSAGLAVRRSSLKTKAAHFSDGAKGDVAVWLATDGYWLGGPDGGARQLQPGRILIDPRTEGRSFLLQRDGMTQVLTLTASPAGRVYGAAIDSATHHQ